MKHENRDYSPRTMIAPIIELKSVRKSFQSADGSTRTVLADVDGMEKAIADLTVLLENLPRPKTSALIECAAPDAPPVDAGAVQPQPTNIYPLFKPLLRDR